VPILHVQFRGQRQAPDGTVTDLPPLVALTERGPCVQITVSIVQSIAQQLQQQGQPLPQPIPGFALIDTGASGTCVDEAAAQQLQLPVVDVVQMASASHASIQANVYPIQIELVGTPINNQCASRHWGCPEHSRIAGPDRQGFATALRFHL